ncbi:hypothetical protein GCM10007385_43670 [Tateyamaria omphalii]|nr:hypothetical protein GCM10007385_43670 [Tateyamaria omphalii]
MDMGTHIHMSAKGRARAWVGACHASVMQYAGCAQVTGSERDVTNAPSRGEGRARPGLKSGMTVQLSGGAPC